MSANTGGREKAVKIDLPGATIDGDLTIPGEATALVLFAHGSGSSRHSPRNRFVAKGLHEAGLATLLMDLLTRKEEAEDIITRRLRFDIDLLGERVVHVTDWLLEQDGTRDLTLGYFGASTGAAAALVAAAMRPEKTAAVVSRGGRPDLAGKALPDVKAPTLMIVGGNDVPVIGMNEGAMEQMNAEVKLEIVPGATHLFQEPGALEEVTRLARNWFVQHLTG